MLVNEDQNIFDGTLIDARMIREFDEFNPFELNKILRNTIKTYLNMTYIDTDILLYGFNNNDDPFQSIDALNGMSPVDLFYKDP